MSAYPNVKFMTSADAARQFPPDQGSEVAIAGRSNAGKSSALNAVVGRKGLARTSRTPGATRLINFFELDPDAGSWICRATALRRCRASCVGTGASSSRLTSVHARA